MSRRLEQLSSTLLRAVQGVLARGLNDPRTDGALITVTGLTISPDLRNATVLISVLPEKKQDLCMHALSHAAGHIRRKASDLVALANMPTLTFKLDLSLKKEARVIRALGLEAPTPPNGDPEAAPSSPAETDRGDAGSVHSHQDDQTGGSQETAP